VRTARDVAPLLRVVWWCYRRDISRLKHETETCTGDEVGNVL
jgi:hypothetical protein